MNEDDMVLLSVDVGGRWGAAMQQPTINVSIVGG
jgi:hypothetical protein